MEIVVLKGFSIATRDSKRFIDELDTLCSKHAISGEYHFKFDVEG